MPRMYWKSTGALLLAIFISFLIWGRETGNTADSNPTTASVLGDQSVAAAPPHKKISAPVDFAKAASAKDQGARESNKTQNDKKALIKAYSCSGQDCSSVTTASTAAEAAWLRDAKYPTAAQLSTYRGMPLASLAQAAENDAAMRALYGERLLDMGRQVDAAQQARLSVAQGSHYGLYELSKIYRASGLLQNRTASLAALRVAYIMGDRKALDDLYLYAGQISLIDLQIVDEQAMGMYRRILSDRTKLVGYGLRVSPRP